MVNLIVKKEVFMNTTVIQKIEHYGDTQHPRWLDLLRMALGAVLLIKGVQFVGNIEGLRQIIAGSRFPWLSIFIAHYVALVHLAGGPLIIAGLVTRVAVLFQIPVLIGAIVFVHKWDGFLVNGSELLFAIIILLLLVFFLVYGSGPLSVDELMKRQKEK